MEYFGKRIEVAIPGDLIGISLGTYFQDTKLKILDTTLDKTVRSGRLLGIPLSPPLLVREFTAQIILLFHPGNIKFLYFIYTFSYRILELDLHQLFIVQHFVLQFELLPLFPSSINNQEKR
jgi:translation elongation factor EF-1alpha